jgi:prepilin-type processing-associated H-X9-DG protein
MEPGAEFLNMIGFSVMEGARLSVSPVEVTTPPGGIQGHDLRSHDQQGNFLQADGHLFLF